MKPQSIPDYLAVVGDSADGYPGYRLVGVQRPRPSSYRSILTLRIFPKIGEMGSIDSQGSTLVRVAVSARGTMPCYFALSPLCGWTFLSSTQSRIFAGKGHPRALKRSADE